MAKTLETVKPKMRLTQEERSSRTRAKLIAAAVECIHELGYANVTMNAIAERAGVSRGATQHQFGTRTDLFLAVMDEMVNQLQKPLTETGDVPEGLEERVGMVVDRYWSAFSGKLMPAVVDIQAGARSDPELFDRLQGHMKAIFRARDKYWHDLFADLDISKERLSAAHEFTSTTACGLAVRHMFKGQRRRSISQTELDYVKQSVVAILRGEMKH